MCVISTERNIGPSATSAAQPSDHISTDNGHAVTIIATKDLPHTSSEERYQMTATSLGDPMAAEEDAALHGSSANSSSSRVFQPHHVSSLHRSQRICNSWRRSAFIGSLRLRRPDEGYTLGNQLRASILRSPANILLLAVPAGFAVNYAHLNPIAVFFVNFAAAVPLSNIVGNAIDDLVKHIGGVLGMVMYMTVGNIAQLIMSIFLLKSGQIRTLKTSLSGALLTMVLLNTGVAFCVGGYDRPQQFFSRGIAKDVGLLLFFGVSTLLVPSVFDLSTITVVLTNDALSHGLAIIIIVLYFCYLFFQLRTHRKTMEMRGQRVVKVHGKRAVARADVKRGIVLAGVISAVQGRPESSPDGNDALYRWTGPEGMEEGPLMSKATCLLTLILGTAILSFHTQYFTDSIGGLIEARVSHEFIGIVLLPILNNDLVAIQGGLLDNMDIAILAALGKSCQMTLFVIPLLILLGWVMGVQDMNFSFDQFEVCLLFLAVYLVQVRIYSGRSNFLQGVSYISLYLIIAVCSWFYPNIYVDGEPTSN